MQITTHAPNWYIATYRARNGKTHFGIARTRMQALREALATMFN